MSVLRMSRLALVLTSASILLASAAEAQHGIPDDSIHRDVVVGLVREGRDYRVYDRRGEPASIRTIVEQAMGDEVLLVGEEHGDRVGHAVERALLEAALDTIASDAGAGRDVVLSLEMFERDVQHVLDEYLAGLISERHFLSSARPWDDYGSRYRPLVETAKARGIPVIGANAPRRYVNRVTTYGPESLEDLSPTARSFLAPLPYPGPSTRYREQWNEAMSEAERVAPADGYRTSPFAVYAQALWDATMAHAITEALVRTLDGFVMHVSGSFHVAEGTGIAERIAGYRPGTRVTSVVLTRTHDVDAWSASEHGALADFVVLTRRSEPTDSIAGDLPLPW